jgi:hypothetical protein
MGSFTLWQKLIVLVHARLCAVSISKPLAGDSIRF